jgi:hypothetical protein
LEKEIIKGEKLQGEIHELKEEKVKLNEKF